MKKITKLATLATVGITTIGAIAGCSCNDKNDNPTQNEEGNEIKTQEEMYIDIVKFIQNNADAENYTLSMTVDDMTQIAVNDNKGEYVARFNNTDLHTVVSANMTIEENGKYYIKHTDSNSDPITEDAYQKIISRKYLDSLQQFGLDLTFLLNNDDHSLEEFQDALAIQSSPKGERLSNTESKTTITLDNHHYKLVSTVTGKVNNESKTFKSEFIIGSLGIKKYTINIINNTTHKNEFSAKEEISFVADQKLINTVIHAISD